MPTLASRYQAQLEIAAHAVLSRLVAEDRPYSEYPQVVEDVLEYPKRHLTMSWEDLMQAVRTPLEELDVVNAVDDAYTLGHTIEAIVSEAVRKDVKRFLEQSDVARRCLTTHRALAELRRSEAYEDNLTRLVNEAYTFSDEFEFDISDPGTYELPSGERLVSAPDLDGKWFHEGHVRGVVLLDPFGRDEYPHVLDTVYAWLWEEHESAVRTVRD